MDPIGGIRGPYRHPTGASGSVQILVDAFICHVKDQKEIDLDFVTRKKYRMRYELLAPPKELCEDL